MTMPSSFRSGSGWTISCCMIGSPDVSDVKSFSFVTPNFSVVVRENTLELWPDAATVARGLMEVSSSKMIYNSTLTISDTITFSLQGRVTIPLGALTIVIDSGAPCPILFWSGQPSSDFDALNAGFERFHKLKSFW
jgi:hypothetical protein